MALREKNPNAGIGYDSSFDTRNRRFPKVVDKKKSVLRTSDDNKENQPPSKYGMMKRPTSIFQDRHTNNVEGFLTEKWAKDSSQPFSVSLLTLPPPIQRFHRSEKNESILPRSQPLTVSTDRDLNPRVLYNGSHEGTVSMGHIYEDEECDLEALGDSLASLLCAGCPVDDPPKGGSFPGADRSFGLDVLGRTRQAVGLLGSDEVQASMPKDSNRTEPDSRKDDSATRQVRSSRMDFSAALRHNLNFKPVQDQKQVTHRSKQREEKDHIPEKRPIKDVCNTASIRTLAASKERGSAEYAEFLLRKMLCDYHEGITTAPPDGGCFNSVVHAYASRGDAVKAEDVLSLMWQEFYRGNLPPDKRIFTTVMYAWQRSEKKFEAPEACEHLLRQMHQLRDTGGAPACAPDTFTYTCILHCWADSERSDAAARAESLFRDLLHRYANGDSNLKPDTICYSNLINVFVNCKKYHAAERILWEMVDTYLSGLHSAEPTVRSFNTLLAVWSKSNLRESPERVQMILKRWKHLNHQGKIAVSPDEYSYALLLKVWSRTNREDSIPKLLEAFEWIKNLNDSGEKCACPDVIKYTTVIGALNKVGQVDRAYVLLGELINKYNEFKEERYRPDSRCFQIVLTAFAQSRGNLSAGKKAESLLRRMWTMHKAGSNVEACPTHWTYNTVVFCYQNAGDPSRAERLLREMDSIAKLGALDRGADIRTFKAVVSAWRTSNDQERDIHIRCLQEEALSRFHQQI